MGATVLRAKRISCKSAALWLDDFGNVSRNHRRIVMGAGESGDLGWRCPKVGSYYEGLIYRCSRRGRLFTTMVGA